LKYTLSLFVKFIIRVKNSNKKEFFLAKKIEKWYSEISVINKLYF